jgi:hypothetical protein
VVRISPFLCNGPINAHSWQKKKIFSVVSVPRRRQSSLQELVEIKVQLWRVNQWATVAEESPLLSFVTRKRLVKTIQRNSHCGKLLPRND